MRHRVQNSNVLFAKRKIEELSITINELHEHMEKMPHTHLANKLMCFRTTLRGTRSY